MTEVTPVPRAALPSHPNRWTIPADGGPIDLRRPAAPRPATLTAAPRDITVDLARTALIIVDLQNDFCAPNGWLASIGVDVSVLAGAVGRSDALARASRAAGVPVIWLNWGDRPTRPTCRLASRTSTTPRAPVRVSGTCCRPAGPPC